MGKISCNETEKIMDYYEFLKVKRNDSPYMIVAKIECYIEKYKDKLEVALFINDFKYLRRLENTLSKLNEAYKIFSNPSLKTEYDKKLNEEENAKKAKEDLKSTLFIIETIRGFEEDKYSEYNVKFPFNYQTILEITNFLREISNKKYRVSDSTKIDDGVVLDIICNAVLNAKISNRSTLQMKDLIDAVSNCRHIQPNYRKDFANDMYDKWFEEPTQLKK